MSTSSLLESEHVTFCGKKKDLIISIIKLRNVGWGDDPGLSWWSLNIVTRALLREWQEIWLQMGEGVVTKEARGERREKGLMSQGEQVAPGKGKEKARKESLL